MTARSDRRLVLTSGIVLAVIFILCAAVQVASWTIGSTEKTSHEVIPGPVQALTIDARSADVTLLPSATGDVVIDSRASATLHTPELEVRPDGARVRVQGGCPNLSIGHCSAELIVRVPASTRVSVEAGSGDIHAQGLAGDVDLHSASGDVSADGLAGADVRLTSASGDIAAGGIRARTLVARTASGDVTVQLASVPASVEARTNSGDVAVFVPPGDEMYRVDADTNSGDKNVGVATSSRAPQSISAHTDSGDVIVDYGRQ